MRGWDAVRWVRSDLSRIAGGVVLMARRLQAEGMVERRSKFKAYDGTNNIFNLAYEALSWKVHKTVIRAKLDTYLGFLHSMQHGKLSLVCNLQSFTDI